MLPYRIGIRISRWLIDFIIGMQGREFKRNSGSVRSQLEVRTCHPEPLTRLRRTHDG